MTKTAVSKLSIFFIILLLPLFSLAWVTQLMAQTAEPQPIIILTEPVTVDEEGADSYQIRFVGLVTHAGKIVPIDQLEVIPADPAVDIAIINAPDNHISPTSLASEDFYITLLIDNSGSMAITNSQAMSGNLALVQAQLTAILDNAPHNAHFSVVGFNGEIRPDQFTAFTNDKDEVRRQIEQLQSEDGSTCLNDVVYTAVQSLAQLPQNSRRALILFTDGLDELRRGQPEQCSENFTFEQAVALAASPPQSVTIPLHTVNYIYRDEASGIEMKDSLPSSDTITAGLSLNGGKYDNLDTFNKNFTDTFNTIIDSFEHQWAVTIELYTPSGTHDLRLTPIGQDGAVLPSQLLTYSADYPHYPAALARSLTLQNIAYDETVRNFEIYLTICDQDVLDQATTVPYCKPENTQALDVYVEDLFTNQAVTTTIPTDLFQLHNESQPITVPHLARLQPEHYYLIRVTAQNGLTAANYHPRAEAVFAYQPSLELLPVLPTITPTLSGFSLRPDLTVHFQVNRVGQADNLQVDPSLLENGRTAFNTVTPRQPDSLTVGGYLVYPNKDAPQELYPLTEQTVMLTNGRAISVTFPGAARGGYADYDLILTIGDGRDVITSQLANLPQPEPAQWYGSLLRQVRRLLAEPLIFVAAILLGLLLLGLIRFVVWLARRAYQPTREKPKVKQEAAVQPARLRVDASPDDSVRYQTYDLPEESPFLIGQRLECQLPIKADNLLAERHARIQKLNGRYFITNCDPDHPTYVNNQEIISEAPYPIRDGDKIRLGLHTRLTFTAPQATQEMVRDG